MKEHRWVRIGHISGPPSWRLMQVTRVKAVWYSVSYAPDISRWVLWRNERIADQDAVRSVPVSQHRRRWLAEQKCRRMVPLGPQELHAVPVVSEAR